MGAIYRLDRNIFFLILQGITLFIRLLCIPCTDFSGCFCPSFPIRIYIFCLKKKKKKKLPVLMTKTSRCMGERTTRAVVTTVRIRNPILLDIVLLEFVDVVLAFACKCGTVSWSTCTLMSVNVASSL